jgi:protein-S-isoprenylcysteine O-methyltransferase Ste14
METPTRDSRSFAAAIIIFAALVIGGVALALKALAAASAVQQSILIGLGSALVAGALAFFLVAAFTHTTSGQPRTNGR